MSYAVEAKLKKIEVAARRAHAASCKEGKKMLARLESDYEHVRDDIHSIRDQALARRLAGKSAKADELLYKAHRAVERSCTGFAGAQQRRRRRRKAGR